MRRVHVVLVVFLLAALFLGVARADTFELTDGTSVSGEVVLPPNPDGLNMRLAQGKYQKVPWEKFSQQSLKELAKNAKIAPFVEGLIEPDEEASAKKTAIDVKTDFDHLDRPTKAGLIGSLLRSPVGLVALLVIYLAGLYAAYEISIVRAYPPVMVCGVAAIAPIVGHIIFLCLPTRLTTPEEQSAATEAAAAAHAEGQPMPEYPPEVAQEVAALHLARHAADPEAAAIPEPQVFSRGKFTFNRRFLETKFPGFFGVVRRDADKEMVLIVKAARDQYEVHRISRISANEVHLDVHKGGASMEVSVPFSEIQEITLKHRKS